MQNKGYKKYRSETVRLKSWDYGWNGVYFITICTNKRKCYFGEVIDFKTDGHIDNVETQDFASLRSGNQKPLNEFGPQSRNLASIVRGFKIGVTKNARIIQPDFKWQPRYYDNIVRDRKSFNRISEYIRNNPTKWATDKYYIQ